MNRGKDPEMNLISCNDSKPSGTFDKAYLVKNSTITTFCRGVGVATGLLLDAVIMGIFGLVSDVDAFFAAMALPLLISSACVAYSHPRYW